MNIQNILTEIEKQDPEVYNRLDTRRNTMKHFAGISKKLALTAIPFALGGMFKKAYAGSTSTKDTVLEVLNYALTLEYLEAKFYSTAVANFGTIGVPTGAPRTAIAKISSDEFAHVNFLKTAITASGGTPISEPNIDLTGGNGSGTGPFAMALTDYGWFLAVAQTFEDTGVRAYKGRATELMGDDNVLTAALQIHSVEARHASHIRQMRYNLNVSSPSTSLVPAGVSLKPWITLNQTGISGNPTQSSYDGEENTTQATIAIPSINGFAVTNAGASKSFDEPLTKAQVLAIVDPFLY